MEFCQHNMPKGTCPKCPEQIFEGTDWEAAAKILAEQNDRLTRSLQEQEQLNKHDSEYWSKRMEELQTTVDSQREIIAQMETRAKRTKHLLKAISHLTWNPET